MHKIKIFLVFIFVIIVNNVFADIPFYVEIRNVTINGGQIILGYFSSQEAFSNEKHDWYTIIEPVSENIVYQIRVPAGEYVIGIHQDTNGNGVMDYRLFGIPREPYGFSNMRGKMPGRFDQMKYRVNTPNQRIIIPLVWY